MKLHRINSLENISFELQEDTNFTIEGVKEKQIDGIYENQRLPLSFRYNGKWLIRGACIKCNKLLVISHADFNSVLKELDNLNTLSYKLEFVVGLQQVFHLTKSICFEDNLYVYNAAIDFNPLFKRSNSIKPYYYVCPHCNSDYFLNMTIVYPRSSDLGYVHGLLGKILVNEIVCFTLEREASFWEWEKACRVRKCDSP